MPPPDFKEVLPVISVSEMLRVPVTMWRPPPVPSPALALFPMIKLLTLVVLFFWMVRLPSPI